MLRNTFSKSAALFGALGVLALGVACTIMPWNVSAQPVTFLIEHTPAGEGEPHGKTRIFTLENCKNSVDASAIGKRQSLTCEVQFRKCRACPFSDTSRCERDPANFCKFLIKSSDRLPVPIFIGQSARSPDCVYATYWDDTLKQTVAIFGPCP